MTLMFIRIGETRINTAEIQQYWPSIERECNKTIYQIVITFCNGEQETFPFKHKYKRDNLLCILDKISNFK